jgi:hypothetical protein
MILPNKILTEGFGLASAHPQKENQSKSCDCEEEFCFHLVKAFEVRKF